MAPTGDEPRYRTHSRVGAPIHMKDYLAEQDAKQRQRREELPALRDWFQRNQAKPAALVTKEGTDAIQRLAELERKLEGQTTVPPAILAWLGLEQPA